MIRILGPSPMAVAEKALAIKHALGWQEEAVRKCR